MLESQDEQRFVDYCKAEKLICEKVKFVQAGYPDRLCILPNALHIWVEFKQPGKKPKPIQVYRMGKLRAATVICGWTDDSGVAIALVQAFMAAARVSETSNTPSIITECGGLIFGSWFGQDVYLPSCDKDLEIERLRIKDPNCRAAEAYVQSVAGRNQQVGRF